MKKLYGFWLGQCIANWTGLSTEMDKIGNVGDSNSGDFYTRNDWGGLSTRTEKIDFVLKVLTKFGDRMTILILSTCINI